MKKSAMKIFKKIYSITENHEFTKEGSKKKKKL